MGAVVVVRARRARTARRPGAHAATRASTRRRSRASRAPVRKKNGRPGLRRHDQRRGHARVRSQPRRAGDTRSPASSRWCRSRSSAGARAEQWIEKFAALLHAGHDAAGRWPSPWRRRWRPARPGATWIYRGLVFLVIACPCALVISTPVSIVSALTQRRAQRRAHQGRHLPGGGQPTCEALALDKTGHADLRPPRGAAGRAVRRPHAGGPARPRGGASRRTARTRWPTPCCARPPRRASWPGARRTSAPSTARAPRAPWTAASSGSAATA